MITQGYTICKSHLEYITCFNQSQCLDHGKNRPEKVWGRGGRRIKGAIWRSSIFHNESVKGIVTMESLIKPPRWLFAKGSFFPLSFPQPFLLWRSSFYCLSSKILKIRICQELAENLVMVLLYSSIIMYTVNSKLHTLESLRFENKENVT